MIGTVDGNGMYGVPGTGRRGGIGRAGVLLFALVAVMWSGSSAYAYEQPFPKWIEVDLTWKDAQTGKLRTERGRLWFRDLPHIDERGRKRGFGILGYYTGIKWFVPFEPGDIWMKRVYDSDHPNTFLLHDYWDEWRVQLAFDSIEVIRTVESQLDQAIEKSGTEKADSTTSKLIKEVTGKDDAAKPPVPAIEGGKKDKKDDKGPLVRFATKEDIGVTTIALAGVEKIVFRTASDGLKREEPTGRFVQYSRVAKGDEGRVQPITATFFGGKDRERFNHADFFSDGRILLAGGFLSLPDIDSGLVKVMGTDPPDDAYPRIETKDRRGRVRVTEPRYTATMVIFSDDLTKLLRVVRLPWGTGTAGKIVLAHDDAIYLTGTVGPHFDKFLEAGVPVTATVEHAAAIEASKRDRKPRPLRDDGFIIKISPDLGEVLWAVRFKHAGVDMFMRPDRKLLVRRDHDLFFVTPDGKTSKGPALDIVGHNMAVDPRTGDMYFGGSYRSGTGLEPYVNPYLYKVNAEGKIVWTAYGWSGPITGVEQHRLVSDSSINNINIGEDGSLSLIGWSDGGNTVLQYQPYDMRKATKKSGFASSTWGATGGLTVRIANIIHMDPETMHVDYTTQYVSYLPTSDVPTLLNLYALHRTKAGDVAVTGACRIGFIETHDAWIKPWYIDVRENRHAQAKSGTFFTLFRPDFSTPRMSTRIPGMAGPQVTGRGNLVLIYGGGGEDEDNIIKRAVQPKHGGELDGYAILVDTQGKPKPPAIPDWQWGERDEKGRLKR